MQGQRTFEAIWIPAVGRFRFRALHSQLHALTQLVGLLDDVLYLLATDLEQRHGKISCSAMPPSELVIGIQELQCVEEWCCLGTCQCPSE